MTKKLYRSKSDIKISGVCAGIAEYINIDPTIIRLLYAIFDIITGVLPGIILYMACVFIIPVEPDYIEGQYQEK